MLLSCNHFFLEKSIQKKSEYFITFLIKEIQKTRVFRPVWKECASLNDTKISFDRRDASIAISGLKQVCMYRIGLKSLSVFSFFFCFVLFFNSIAGTEPFVHSLLLVWCSHGAPLCSCGQHFLRCGSAGEIRALPVKLPYYRGRTVPPCVCCCCGSVMSCSNW